jgi:hypothetical protein
MVLKIALKKQNCITLTLKNNLIKIQRKACLVRAFFVYSNKIRVMKYKYEDMSSIDKISIGFSNFLLNNLQAEHGKLKYRKNKSNFDWILNMWYSWKKNQNVHPIKELEGKLYTPSLIK